MRTDFCPRDDIFAPPGRNELIVWKTDSRFFFSRLWEARALRARKTLTPRFTDFFTDFEKKTDCFAVYLIIIGCIKKNTNNNICLYAA